MSEFNHSVFQSIDACELSTVTGGGWGDTFSAIGDSISSIGESIATGFERGGATGTTLGATIGGARGGWPGAVAGGFAGGLIGGVVGGTMGLGYGIGREAREAFGGGKRHNGKGTDSTPAN